MKRPKCKIKGCKSAHIMARGMCNAHYLKWHRYGDPLADHTSLRGNKTHGGRHDKEYKSWAEMHQRCTNENCGIYRYYGGRGISVCKRWNRYENFIADMGRKPTPKHTLERINNDGNYTPSNCRWATRKEQARNRRSNRIVLFRGRKMLLCDVADMLGVKSQTLSMRMSYGLPLDFKR